MPSQKHQVVDLLKAIESGAPRAIDVVRTDKYIQHNCGPLTASREIGLLAPMWPAP